MPSGFMTADVSRPNFTGRESTEEKVRVLEDYLFLLLEQLRYSLRNIGPENMNTTEVVKWLRDEGVGLDQTVEEEIEEKTAELVIQTLIAQSVITEELYADYGAIADLTVDRLRTDYRRAYNYLRGDTGDINYIYIHDEQIEYITASTDGSQAVQLADGGRRFWWRDGTRTVMTSVEETQWPVMVYVYDELVKAKFAFENDLTAGTWIPTMTFGAGNESGNDRLRIRKGVGLAELLYRADGGKSVGITMSLSGYLDLYGLRRLTEINFSGWESGYFSETVEGPETYNFGVEFDAGGNPVRIYDLSHSVTVVWPAETGGTGGE